MRRIIALCITICAFIAHFQPVIAQSRSDNIGLAKALQMMQQAREHSGYSLDQTNKCLFPYIATVCDNWTDIPPLLRRGLEGMFQRPDKPQSWWYKAGLPLTVRTPHFRLHYTTTGPDAVLSRDVSPLNGVPDLVDICAESFEKAYRVEIAQMGYKVPFDDFWMADNGGDERYDVYLFSGPWLGFTMPEFPMAMQSTAAMAPLYFGINSRLYEYFGASEGERYLETTCAHEFFHSVQFAYNYFMPRWFMEACSTWVERIVYDGSDQGETDGNNYYNSQLAYWFRYPDWSLTRFDGWHEYGDVIWSIFLTERYDLGIIREIYEDLSEGTYRELSNFYDAFDNRGTTLSVAFKEFTLWNYFTNYRYDGRFYSHGSEYPPIAVHLDDIHREYPVRMHLDSEQAPEHLGARYVRFLPQPGQETLSIKVDGSDITDPDELRRLDIWGTRGWGAKLVIYRKGKQPNPDEIFPFQMSQEGQRNFTGFGTEIEEVALILSNLHPDLDMGSVSYAAGQPPAGKLSEPKLSRNDRGEIQVFWELVDLSDIKEVAIVRKRFAPSEWDQDDSNIQVAEVYGALDADSNGIPDGNVNIIGKAAATDTVFLDNTTFMDVESASLPGFDYGSVRYYYAVVPVDEYGIMGEPVIASNGITPTAPPSPTVVIDTQFLAPGEWQVELHASQPLIEPPSLVSVLPDGRQVTIKLSKTPGSNQLWQGKLSVDFFPPTGTYKFVVSAKGRAGSVGTVITQGQQFSYVVDDEKKLTCGPNPFKPDTHKVFKFYPPGFQIRIFTITGELVKELPGNEWDGTNEENQPVASGIYVYLAEHEETEKTGKIAVVR